MPDGEAYRLGELWANLPRASRTVRRLDPDAEWDATQWLLWQVEFDMRAFHWASTYDRKHPTPKPKPLRTPGQAARARQRRDNALAAKDEIRAALGMPPE